MPSATGIRIARGRAPVGWPGPWQAVAGARHPVEALRIALLGLVVGAEQVAGYFGDRHQVARIDLGFVFLGAVRQLLRFSE